jgi:diacylglycerol kinase family enzyme
MQQRLHPPPIRPRHLEIRVFIIVVVALPSSTPLKTCFIVNPRSGHAARILDPVRSFARSRGDDVVFTARPGHAGELAAQAVAAGCELVVSVGGDGTMNEVAGALVGTSAILGLVPCGSGNGLGRHLGIHGPPAHVFAVLQHGRPRSMDTGLADGHPFFSIAGIGLEAEIAHRFNRLSHRGLPGYLKSGFSTFCEWHPQACTISHAGRRETLQVFTLAVANAGQYGNNARIAPDARIDDGSLDLVAVPPLTPWNALPLLFRLFSGGLGTAKGVAHRRADCFVIERNGPGLLHTDGEVHATGPIIEFRVRPASLRVMCPVPDTQS